MTPTERLQAAIDRLTELRDKSTPGEWMATWRDVGAHNYAGAYIHQAPETFNRIIGQVFSYEGGAPRSPELARADADLIVTLHRTIDAQLNILRDELRALTPMKCGCSCRKPWKPALTLADVILGAAS